MKHLVACGVALGLCAFARGAFAEDASAEDTPVPLAPQVRAPSAQPPRRWYGWQLLINDAASLSLLVGGLSMSKGALYQPDTPVMANVMATIGIAGYWTGAPVLHLVHGRPKAAAGSLALRFASPIVGGALGYGLASCSKAAQSEEWIPCGLAELVLGFSAGVLTATILDASLLAWSPLEPAPRPAPRIGFAPVISNDGKRGELRVFGTF
jgi:hypothetical protein